MRGFRSGCLLLPPEQASALLLQTEDRSTAAKTTPGSRWIDAGYIALIQPTTLTVGATYVIYVQSPFSPLSSPHVFLC